MSAWFHLSAVFFLTSLLSVAPAAAEAVRGSLFLTKTVASSGTAAGAFVGRSEGGLFARMPPRQSTGFSRGVRSMGGKDVETIRALIEKAESRRDGYDAVQFGARIKPAKRPTKMTLAEIFDWIEDTPGQPHAIGRYQFIPKTLQRVVAKTGVDMTQQFSPRVQDLLADVLLMEAGLNEFRGGALGRRAFMNNLAKIWAGLPNSTGQSHYHNYAGNKASVSWAYFDQVMARISPERG